MFRFTIRDVLWLTVAVGLACGWWIDRQWLIDITEDEIVQNATAIASSWAKEKGSAVKIETRRLRIEERPDGSGSVSGDSLRWRLGRHPDDPVIEECRGVGGCRSEPRRAPATVTIRAALRGSEVISRGFHG
jgi:hypothetical protein